MVTFTTKADRRSSMRSKEVLSAREAGLIYTCVRKKCAESSETASLSRAELERAAGRDWEKKIHKYAVGAAQDEVIFALPPIVELATSAVSAQELASMVAQQFRGAARALAFIKGRMKNQNLEQVIAISEELMARHLGPLWAQRLAAAGITYDR